MKPEIIALAATLIAALLAAGAAIWAAIISSRTSRLLSEQAGSQKIAEFRKEWIENLRTHFAEFASTRFRVDTLNSQLNDVEDVSDAKRFGEEMIAKYERLTYIENYILLMLNPSEDLHQQMDRKLKALAEELREKMTPIPRKPKPTGVDTAADAKSSLPKFYELAQRILKVEWDKLKSETRRRI